ncbi:TPA: hypothetical protein HA225_00180 [Candidatus Micrarchaeota archaeon]|nr:hypothetical protein [Candidatus Micrarchaeota archaeon]
MFVFQVQKNNSGANDSLNVKIENIVDSIPGYKEIKDRIALVSKWCESLLDKRISNDLYYNAKNELLSESERLSGLLRQSVYSDTKFKVAIAYLEDMASMLRNDENVNDEIPPFKKEMKYVEGIINTLIRDMERAESEFLRKKKIEEGKNEKKNKKILDKKTVPIKTRTKTDSNKETAEHFKKMVQGVTDEQARKNLVGKILQLALECNKSEDEIYQAIAKYNPESVKNPETGDAWVVEQLDARINYTKKKLTEPKK